MRRSHAASFQRHGSFAFSFTPLSSPIDPPANGGAFEYDTVLHNINYNLKKIGEAVGFSIPLTMYVARHSWASAASQSNIPLHVISQCLGHDSEHTTQIYLASIDVNQMDEANEKIIRKLK